jgi:hypothetical protein
LWNNVAIDRGVLFQKPQAPLRIVAISGAAWLLIHARRILKIGRSSFRHLSRSVYEHDLARAAARHSRKRRIDPASAWW